MKKGANIFDYLGQIFMVFGYSVLTLNIFCLLFGESAKGFSTIFSLGGEGLGIATLLEFFLLCAVIVTLRFLLFTDGWIRNLSIPARTTLMFGLVILAIILFVILFGWFPVDYAPAWIGFFLCFGISAGVSTAIAAAKERLENKKMEEALERLKKEN